MVYQYIESLDILKENSPKTKNFQIFQTSSVPSRSPDPPVVHPVHRAPRPFHPWELQLASNEAFFFGVFFSGENPDVLLLFLLGWSHEYIMNETNETVNIPGILKVPFWTPLCLSPKDWTQLKPGSKYFLPRDTWPLNCTPCVFPHCTSGSILGRSSQ